MELKEKFIISLIKDLEVVFDIGAREDGVEFIEIRPDAEYHFFEPFEDFAESLKNKIPPHSKSVVNQYGMWEENIDNSQYYLNTQSFIPHPFGFSVYQGHVFNLRTIDWYVNENNITKIDFLKIDAEGSDYKILLGAKKTLDSNMIKYIQFEYWDGVRKFYNLLKDKYDMFFIKSENNIERLTEDVIIMIDEDRIPKGMGGDIFCSLKELRFTI